MPGPVCTLYAKLVAGRRRDEHLAGRGMGRVGHRFCTRAATAAGRMRPTVRRYERTGHFCGRAARTPPPAARTRRAGENRMSGSSLPAARREILDQNVEVSTGLEEGRCCAQLARDRDLTPTSSSRRFGGVQPLQHVVACGRQEGSCRGWHHRQALAMAAPGACVLRGAPPSRAAPGLVARASPRRLTAPAVGVGRASALGHRAVRSPKGVCRRRIAHGKLHGRRELQQPVGTIVDVARDEIAAISARAQDAIERRAHPPSSGGERAFRELPVQRSASCPGRTRAGHADCRATTAAGRDLCSLLIIVEQLGAEGSGRAAEQQQGDDRDTPNDCAGQQLPVKARR